MNPKWFLETLKYFIISAALAWVVYALIMSLINHNN